MKADIIKHFLKKDKQGLITDEKVLIQWSSPKGFGELIFRTKDGNYIVDAEAMSFEHIKDVLKALD